jgi:hypothetical protein
VLLMVLLAMMLVAVIRLPERHGSSEEAARPPREENISLARRRAQPQRINFIG